MNSKTFFHLLAIMMVAMVFVLFSSCNNDDDNKVNSPIIPLDITVNDNGGRSSSLKRNPVYLYLEKNAQIKGQRSLVSMNEMRNSLRMSMPKIMNQIMKLFYMN